MRKNQPQTSYRKGDTPRNHDGKMQRETYVVLSPTILCDYMLAGILGLGCEWDVG